MKTIADALTYPIRGSGKYMLFWGAVLTIIGHFASLAPLFGFFSWIFISAYFCATYFSIVETTAVGQASAPQFPDVSNILEDLLFPLCKVISLIVLCLAPYLVLVFLQNGKDAPLSDFFFYLGIFYFPMATLAVIVLGHLTAFMPQIVFPAIFRAGWSYLIAVVFLLAIYYLKLLLAAVFEGFPFFGALIMGLVGMFVMMAGARMLGLIYREHEEELNWL